MGNEILIGINGAPVVELLEELYADPALKGRIGIIFSEPGKEEKTLIDPSQTVNISYRITDNYKKIDINFEGKYINDTGLKKSIDGFNNSLYLIRNFVYKFVNNVLSLQSGAEETAIVKLLFILDASDPSSYGFFQIFSDIIYFLEKNLPNYEFQYQIFLLSLKVTSYNYINIKTFLGQLPTCPKNSSKKSCKITDFATLYIIENVNEVGVEEKPSDRIKRLTIWFKEYLSGRLRYHEQIEQPYIYERKKGEKSVVEQQKFFYTVSFGLLATVIPEKEIGDYARTLLFKDIVNLGSENFRGIEGEFLLEDIGEEKILKLHISPEGALYVSPHSVMKLPNTYSKLMPFGSAVSFAFPEEAKKYRSTKEIIEINSENVSELIKESELDAGKLYYLEEELKSYESEVSRVIKKKVYQKIEKFFERSKFQSLSKAIDSFLIFFGNFVDKLKNFEPVEVVKKEKPKGKPVIARIARIVEYSGLFLFTLPDMFLLTVTFTFLPFVVSWFLVSRFSLLDLYFWQNNPIYLIFKLLDSGWIFVLLLVYYFVGLIYFNFNDKELKISLSKLFFILSIIIPVLIGLNYYMKAGTGKIYFAITVLPLVGLLYFLSHEKLIKKVISDGIIMRLRCLPISDCSAIFEDYFIDKDFKELVKEVKGGKRTTSKDVFVVYKLLVFLVGLQAIKDIGGSFAVTVSSSALNFFFGNLGNNSIIRMFVEEILSRPVIVSIYLLIFASLSYMILAIKDYPRKSQLFFASISAVLASLVTACLTSPHCAASTLLTGKTFWILLIVIVIGYISDYKFRRGYYKTLLNIMLKKKREQFVNIISEKMIEYARRIWDMQVKLYERILGVMENEKKKIRITVDREIPYKISQIKKILNKHKDIGPLDVDFEAEAEKFYNQLKSFNYGKLNILKERIISEIPVKILSPVILGEEKSHDIVQMVDEGLDELEESIKSNLEKFSIESLLVIKESKIVNLDQRKLETEPYPFWSVSRRDGMYSRAYVGRPPGMSEKADNIIYNYLILDIPNRFDIHYVSEEEETFTTPTKYDTDKNTLSVIYYRYGPVNFEDFSSRKIWKEKFNDLPVKEKKKSGRSKSK